MKSGFKGDSWFGSVTCADELGSRNKKALLSVCFCLYHVGLGMKGTRLD